LQSSLLAIKFAIPPAQKALGFLSAAGKVKNKTSNKELEKPPAPLSVVLDGVTFSHTEIGQPFVKDLSLEVEPGSTVALIGMSGSGKSTIAELILGLLSPRSGTILIGGFSPAQIYDSMPGMIGYVPQKPGLIFGSISQNIAIGVASENVDDRLLWDAIRSANLLEFVESLPDGVHTDIGKRKDELSGGQLQRIGLARALYSKPKLLILDEATSALDAESESEITAALQRMHGAVTIIMIAHRLNTIQNSDRVYLLDTGSIIASGTFQELVKTNPRVRNLVRLMEIKHDRSGAEIE
jgi:ATP-binding cassette subfamily C protein